MKKIFLLLVFLNGVLLFWGFNSSKMSDNAVRQTSLYNKTKVDELVLLSEVSAEEKVAKPSKVNVNKTADVQALDVLQVADVHIKKTVDVQVPNVPKVIDVYTCYVVRPLKEKEANALRSKLESSVVEVLVSLQLEPQEYWVMIPATGSWAHSLSKLEEIKRKGVKDFWLLSQGENKGVISLGVYKTAGRAQNRLHWLRQRSVNAMVIGRKHKSKGYVVRLKTKDALDSIKPHLIGLQKKILKISC